VSTSILLIDDHPIVRQGLRSLLSNYPEFRVVGEAATVEEAVEPVPPAAAGRQPRRHPAGRRVRAGPPRRAPGGRPGSAVLVVSSFDDDEYVTRSLRAGALGYVLKVDSPSVLVTAIETVAAGQRALSPRVTGHLVEQLMGEATSQEPDLDQLELRMLQMLSRGLSNGQIADELYMSDTTVKAAASVVFGKLGVSRRAGGGRGRRPAWPALRGFGRSRRST
jgi:DNA-binding NarL/FixJ family response regulator